MWAILGSLLSLLDKVFGYVSDVETTKLTTTAAVEETEVNAMSSVERQWWFVSLTIPLFAFPYIVYTWKAVLWDKIIEHGLTKTDSLVGPLGTAYWIILSGLFLHAISTSNK